MKKDNWVYVIIPFLVSIAVFAVSLALLRWALAAAALLSLGCYVGLSFLLVPVLRIGGVHVGRMKNGAEIITLLDEGEKDLSSIKTIIDTSNDPDLKTKALRVYREGGSIVEYIKKNPAKAVMARRFFTYYLDKSVEILNRYHDLASAGIETEKLRALKQKTLSALESVLRGMVLQFSRLISSEVIDIEADIKLLENIVRTEDS
ncbi:MAG: 5-bromo-4-chloroindolyl phosphate hydrolysis family protein [Treponema sp.]|jgi:hypothetical protein|nr:5-bromo-4-chloroindolyl phosphate hydrolysis family protein [Treponema sp.]